MPKYEVTMNYVEAKSATFVVEAEDEDTLHDLIGELDGDMLEKMSDFWYTSDFEPPIIDKFKKVHRDTPVHETIQKAMDDVEKAWEAL
jgi:hypothetical protein